MFYADLNATFQRISGSLDPNHFGAPDMANSAGGQILCGVEEDKTTRKSKGLDQGISDPKITREWIQQVVEQSGSPTH
ncbi:ATP-binding protein [Bradyrhizobium sp. 141]|uniref:ATP-binding protein n=1 Tax=Bradyrhizobium sp. 141 TaxID=2782617 RepID=UPI001FF6FEEF|nr:ATP-binding protein [Bradyrhizobium sp. 141]MCK1719854.1 hypothetical protein [Bradyrhizobium sp. 141]